MPTYEFEVVGSPGVIVERLCDEYVPTGSVVEVDGVELRRVMSKPPPTLMGKKREWMPRSRAERDGFVVSRQIPKSDPLLKERPIDHRAKGGWAAFETQRELDEYVARSNDMQDEDPIVNDRPKRTI